MDDMAFGRLEKIVMDSVALSKRLAEVGKVREAHDLLVGAKDTVKKAFIMAEAYQACKTPIELHEMLRERGFFTSLGKDHELKAQHLAEQMTAEIANGEAKNDEK